MKWKNTMMNSDFDLTFRLYALLDEELEILTGRVSEFVDHLQKTAAGIIPEIIIKMALKLEIECCEEMTRRGIIDHDDDDSREYTPIEFDPPVDDPVWQPDENVQRRHFGQFFDFIQGIDFDTPVDDDDLAGA